MTWNQNGGGGNLLPWKLPALVKSVGSNITLSGLQTIDTIALNDDDRVLLVNQTDGIENGVWLVHAGAWTRPTDFATGMHVAGSAIIIELGTVGNAGTVELCVSDPGSDVVGTNVLTFVKFASVSLASSPPVNVTKSVALTGVSSFAARADHKHDVDTTIAGTIAIGDSAAEGIATTLARSDHVHALPSPSAPVNVDKSAGVSGSAITVARSDHKHDISTASAVSAQIGQSNAEGTATTLARSDHAHAHASSTPVNVDKSANVEGTAATFSRTDHKHDATTAAAVNIGVANSEGTATTLARADHIHNLPFGPVQTVLGAATSAVSLNGQEIQNIAMPGSAASAASKGYVDSLVSGLSPKASVLVKSTTNVALSTLQTIDGVILTNNDRILLTDQTTGSENGIWLAHVGAWTRSTDLAVGAHAAGAFTFVESGTLHTGEGWICTSVAPSDVVGTNSLTFAKFSAFPLATVSPLNVNKSAAAVGTSSLAAREDHKHDINTAVVGSIAIGDVAIEGTATTLARSDHTHALPTPAAPVNVDKSAASTGVATTTARADHKHDVSTAAPGASINAGDTSVQGTATTLARSDHQHAVSTAAVGNLVAVDASAASAGTGTTLPRADHKHQVSTAAPTVTVKSEVAAASTGTAATVLRTDAQLQAATATAVSIDVANSQGASSSLSRADHVHAHGNQTVTTLHALATAGALPSSTGSAGFISGTDQYKLNNLPEYAVKHQLITSSVAAKQSYTIPIGNYFLDASTETTLEVNTGSGFIPVTFSSGYTHYRRTSPGTPTTVNDAAIGFTLVNPVSAGWTFRFAWYERRISVSPIVVTKVLASLDHNVQWNSNDPSNFPNAVVVAEYTGMQVEFWRRTLKSGGYHNPSPGLFPRNGKRYMPYFRGTTNTFLFPQSTFAPAGACHRQKFKVCYYNPLTGSRSALSSDIIAVCSNVDDYINGRKVRTARSVWIE